MGDDRGSLGIEKIRQTIKERTDIIMPFSTYIVVYAVLLIIGFIMFAAFGDIVGFIPAAIFEAYIFYLLIKRENEHFKREKKLLRAIRNFLTGKISESKIDKIERELKDREMYEGEKSPILWPILSIVTMGIAGLYVYYFLTKDIYTHDKRESFVLQDIHGALEDVGIIFLIPLKREKIPERNFLLYLFLTIVTFGIFGIYWFYVLFRDPNLHFEYQREWEDRLLEVIEKPREKLKLPEPVTLPERVPAKMRLPEREIEITQDETVFGKEDFEGDLPEEELKYISRRIKPHFIILQENNRYYIQDDNSTNGTKLNGMEIKGSGRQELKDNDEIILGGNESFIIKFRREL